jgi:nicotinamidase-related amidase
MWRPLGSPCETDIGCHEPIVDAERAGAESDVAVESTARAASDLAYRTIVVSDACTADSDESHTRSLDVLRKWFAETSTADEVLSALTRRAAAA